MKSKYRIVPAQLEHIEELFLTMRELDAESLIASGFPSAIEGLKLHFDRSQYAWAAIDLEGVAAVWGFFTPTILSGRAFPWLVGTERMTNRENVRAFLRECREFLTFAREQYDVLEAYQLVSRSDFLPWLRWCGFNIGKAEKISFLGQEYYHIEERVR